MFSKKYIIGGAIAGLILLISFLFSLPDDKLHIVFCDVGQGDAAYIRFPDGEDMLIDGGPNDKVLNCLGNNMPFYDRTIDMVVLTHPQKDHLQGLISVLQRYDVKYFVIGVEGHTSDGYRQLIEGLKKENAIIKTPFKGDEIILGEAKIRVLWPTRQFVAANATMGQCINATMENATMRCLISSNGDVLGVSTETDLNDFSYYMHLQYGQFDALFTGDGDSTIQDDIMLTGVIPDVEVLKFPHHGSRTGILPEFLDKAGPELAVISVGKNSYGHPTREALEILSERDIKILRTDKDGEVEVVSDGLSWSVN